MASSARGKIHTLKRPALAPPILSHFPEHMGGDWCDQPCRTFLAGSALGPSAHIFAEGNRRWEGKVAGRGINTPGPPPPLVFFLQREIPKQSATSPTFLQAFFAPQVPKNRLQQTIVMSSSSTIILPADFLSALCLSKAAPEFGPTRASASASSSTLSDGSGSGQSINVGDATNSESSNSTSVDNIPYLGGECSRGDDSGRYPRVQFADTVWVYPAAPTPSSSSIFEAPVAFLSEQRRRTTTTTRRPSARWWQKVKGCAARMASSLLPCVASGPL
ncbi:hypothetical protein BDZ88DRAFT_308285 [Geranomyces variabilis]|nr:hypothetical protein BDZ88DRAFT_308285 [Geranomyces variabilis]